MTQYLRMSAALALAGLGLSGCLAKTAYNVATAPVRVASKAVDWTTTSQSEADRNRGREIRRREERLGELDRTYGRQQRRCQQGDQAACREAERTYAQIDALRPQVPLEPR